MSHKNRTNKQENSRQKKKCNQIIKQTFQYWNMHKINNFYIVLTKTGDRKRAWRLPLGRRCWCACSRSPWSGLHRVDDRRLSGPRMVMTTARLRRRSARRSVSELNAWKSVRLGRTLIRYRASGVSSCAFF